MKGDFSIQTNLTVMMSFSKSWILFVLFLLVGCGGGGEEAPEMQDFNGTISEVNVGEKAITVNVPDTAEAVDPGMLTLNFTDTTEVLKDFMAMPIDSLQVDQNVRVEAMKEGDQYVPSRVLILGN